VQESASKATSTKYHLVIGAWSEMVHGRLRIPSFCCCLRLAAWHSEDVSSILPIRRTGELRRGTGGSGNMAHSSVIGVLLERPQKRLLIGVHT